jgi:hypothetical protein
MDDLNTAPMKHTRSIPILVDNSLNRALSIKYAIFAMFGFTGILTGIPSIVEVSGYVVATIIAAVVMVTAGFASVATWNTEKGVGWQKLAIYSIIAFISFSLVYNVALIWLTLLGDAGRANVAVLATALLVMPVWHCRYLTKRVAATA